MGNRRTNALTKDIGSTGLDAHWGYIRDDFDTDWNMPKKAEVIDEMVRTSSAIGALRFAIEMSLRSVDWFYESDLGQDDPRLDFVKESMDGMSHSWEAHVSDALMCLFYGWSMFTSTYKRDNGRLLWKKFKPLKNDTLRRWLWADDGGLAGIEQWPSEWPEPIPIERMVIYKIRSNYGNPEGESILRPAYPDYYYQKNFKSLEGIAYERSGAGYPVIKLPEGADTSDTTSDNSDYGRASKIVRNVRLDEQSGVVLPFGWEFSFENPKAGTTLDFDKPISRYEKRILTAALSQFLIIGQDKVGALSLSEDQTDFFRMAVNTMADIIADTHSQYPLKRLLRLNGFDDSGIRLSHSPAGDTDITVIGDFLQKTGTLINWTEQDEIWLRSIGNMPEKSIEELEMLNEEKRERAAQMQQPIMVQSDNDNERDDNRVNFAAGNAPDDDDRRKFERKWDKKWRAFFDGQMDRVVKGVDNA